MESKTLSMICYLIALILAGIGAILYIVGIGVPLGALIFVYAPIILIALGLLLPLILKE